MRRARTLTFAAIGVVVLLLGAGMFVLRGGEDQVARCGDGFVVHETRCLPAGCPTPFVSGPKGCDAPDLRVEIPATELLVGPSDWEAEGRVPPRTVRVARFAIDAFEVTLGKWTGEPSSDAARAASGMPYGDAARFCAARGGRLPTEDEWIVAAAGERGSRYPWGDTGAVCRRAAWGLASGPCARGATSPDTVGAHASGASPRGLHDLAGNVAEWVAAPADARVAAARGGSFRTALAADLRTWARRELEKESKLDDVGFRCAYDVP